MRLPNFFMVGAGKAGTSSLYSYLKEHPDIYMSPYKEPHYFADQEALRRHIDIGKMITSWEEYLALFDAASDERILGEASTSYLHYADPRAIKRISQDAKVLITLRNPIDRAVSHYAMDVQAKLINPYSTPFSKAIKEIPMFLSLGYYYEKVANYIEVFGEKSVKIIFYDDLKADVENAVSDIYRYLGVDSSFRQDLSKQYNVSLWPRNRAAHLLYTNNSLKNLARRILPEDLVLQIKRGLMGLMLSRRERPALDEETQRYLVRCYKPDIEKLSDLVRKDLSHWVDYDESMLT